VHILIGLVILVVLEIAAADAVEEMMQLDFQLLQEMILVMKLHLKGSLQRNLPL
jgi:hypothetical protein